jgi:arylsulfatase A-like enzyme
VKPSDRLFLALILVVAATVAGCASRERGPLNIVFITLDTTRSDHLSCYGYFRETSPNLDAFARECRRFTRCLTPMATTLPAHASMLTGVFPLEHGILANLKHGGWRFEPSPVLRSYAAIAAEHDYHTAAFVSATPLKRDTGIDAGFAVFDEPQSSQRRAGETNERVFAWLDEEPSGPYLLWVHYFDPHTPYDPPAPWDTLYTTDAGLERFIAEREISDRSERMGGKAVDAREAANLYDGEIRYMDSELGLLLDRLREREDWERTIVIIVGDHGEGLNQHGYPGHGFIHHEQILAPFLLRIPGEAGTVDERLCSVVDLFPTVLGTGRAPGAEAFAAQATGRDVLAADFTARPVLSRMSQRRGVKKSAMVYALTDERWKFVYDPDGGHRLHDLRVDPFELTNAIADEREVAERMQAALLEEVGRQEARGEEVGAGRATERLPDEAIEQLRSLGYVE